MVKASFTKMYYLKMNGSLSVFKDAEFIYFGVNQFN